MVRRATANFDALVLQAVDIDRLGDEFVRAVLEMDRNTYLFGDSMRGYDWGSMHLIDARHRFSSRSRNNAPGRSSGATLLLWRPSYSVFVDAVRMMSDGGVLAVAEAAGDTVLGWAQAVGAHDFGSNADFEPLPPALLDLAEFVAFNAHNGFGPKTDQEIVRGAIARAHHDGVLDRRVIAASVAFDNIRSSRSLDWLDKAVSACIPRPKFWP